jgi:hypothetical protein
MIALYGIRRLSENVYDMDVEEDGVREWLRMGVEGEVIVAKGAWAATRVWLLRPLTQIFAAYLRGNRIEFPLYLEPHLK